MSSPFEHSAFQSSPAIEEMLGFSGSGDASDPAKCPHIISALSDEGERGMLVNKYKAAVAWSARRSHDAVHSAKRRKVRTPFTRDGFQQLICLQLSSPECGTCGVVMHRPFVCLSCGYAGCWNGEHATEHLADEGHPFCDCSFGSSRCICLLIHS